MVKKNILGTIGTTPMVRINRLCPNPNVKIFAKLEGFNPTGSIKDRIALRMIEAAERDGRLTPGKTIIEPTSGNTGIGLAIVGIVKGYPVEIVMSEAVSIERRKIIRSYGAKVILTPAEEGTDGAIRLARKKVADAPGRYFMPDQFANASNYLAHYQSTALEIWQQTGGNIDSPWPGKSSAGRRSSPACRAARRCWLRCVRRRRSSGAISSWFSPTGPRST